MYDPASEPGRPAQDARREPIPPAPSRQDVLGRLRTERWHAQQAGETARVAQLDAQIQRLSAANNPQPPARETTSATPPVREATAATRPRTTRKGSAHVVRD